MKFDLKKTYEWTIEKSVGSRMFQNCWFNTPEGKLVEVCQDGDLSCAYFVSSILYRFDLISTMHVRVESLEKELTLCGWHSTERLLPGVVVVWEPKLARDGEMHRHIGFYLCNDECVSNDPKGTVPIFHDVYFRSEQMLDSNKLDPIRKIEKIYAHPFLLE